MNINKPNKRLKNLRSNTKFYTMKNILFILLMIIFSADVLAQEEIESIKKSELTSLVIDDAIYSEVTAKTVLKNKNIIIGGLHYAEDKSRLSTLLLFDAQGNSIPNGYNEDFLSYSLYDGYENSITDLAPCEDGGAYVLGFSRLGNYYTGYLVKVDETITIDENFMIQDSEDNGFIRIHSYKMIKPYTEDKFQELEDTTYTQPKKVLVQKDGKIVIVGITRKQNWEKNYRDGASFVTRLFPDGSLDTSFGIDGYSYINLSEKCNDVSTAILDADDNIILYGLYDHKYSTSSHKAFEKTYSAKLDSDGALDLNFGENGVYVFDLLEAKCNPVAIIEQEDNSLLFFSNKETMLSEDDYTYTLSIIKLDEDGILQTDFYDNGEQIINKMGVAFTDDVIKTADQKIVICGTNKNLLKAHLEDTETLFSSYKNTFKHKKYSKEELNEEVGIGFSLRLNEDCSLDKSYPKNSCFFMSKKDLRQKINFSKMIASTENNFLIFGGGNPEKNNSVLGFIYVNITTSLDFGELVNHKEMAMSFYPNPVKDKAFIDFKLSNEEIIDATLYDLSGRMVQTIFTKIKYEKGVHKESITINSDIPAGFYVITLKGKQVSKSIKIIIE